MDLAIKDRQKKRQHYVPQLVLKQFVGHDPVGHIWTYDKETLKSRSSLTKETAFSTRFYSSKDDDGTWDDRIEECFALIESGCTGIYNDLLLGKLPMNSSDKLDFAYFLAMSYLRTPGMRRIMATMIGQNIQTLMFAHASHDASFSRLVNGQEKTSGKKLTDVERDQLRQNLLQPDRFILQIPKERTIGLLPNAEKFGYILADMNWTIFDVTKGFLITSDFPLTKICNPATIHPVLGDGGFMNKTVEVSFPLSREKLLMLTWSRDIPAKLTADRRLVETMNDARAAFSERFIYAHLDHKCIHQRVKRFRNFKHGIKASGFGPENYAEVTVTR